MKDQNVAHNLACKLDCTHDVAVNYNALAVAGLAAGVGAEGGNQAFCCYAEFFVSPGPDVPQDKIAWYPDLYDRIETAGSKIMEHRGLKGYCIYKYDCLAVEQSDWWGGQTQTLVAYGSRLTYIDHAGIRYFGHHETCTLILTEAAVNGQVAAHAATPGAVGDQFCFTLSIDGTHTWLFDNGILSSSIVVPKKHGAGILSERPIAPNTEMCIPYGNLWPDDLQTGSDDILEAPAGSQLRCEALAMSLQLSFDLFKLKAALDAASPAVVAWLGTSKSIGLRVKYKSLNSRTDPFRAQFSSPVYYIAVPKVWKMNTFELASRGYRVQSLKIFNKDIHDVPYWGQIGAAVHTDFGRCNSYSCIGVYTNGAKVASGYLEHGVLGKLGLGGQLWQCYSHVLQIETFKNYFEGIVTSDKTACASSAFRKSHFACFNTPSPGAVAPQYFEKWLEPEPFTVCGMPAIARSEQRNGDPASSFGFDFGSFATGFDFTSRKLSSSQGSFGWEGGRQLQDAIELVDSVLDASPMLEGRRRQLEAWDDLLHMDIGEVSDVFDELREELENGDTSGRVVRKLAETAGVDDNSMVWKIPYGATYGKAAPKVAADETAFDHAQDAEFVPGTDLYDNTIMQAFHNMPAIAYCSDDAIAQWDCPLCQKQAGISDVKVVADDDGDAKAFVAAATHAGKPVVQVIFHGSMQADLLHWARDAELVNFKGCEKCKVNKAFSEDYQDLSTTLRAAITEVLAKHPGASVQLLGQGFGGALVPFAALDLVGDFPVSAVITLGKPRVGNVQFSDFFQASKAGAISFRLVHWRDPLPHVPPMEMGFIHESQEVWYDAASANYRMCAGVEHPDCSDSVYVFNVTDHLSFFGGDLLKSTLACAGDDNGMAKAMHGVNNAQKLMTAASSPIQAADAASAQAALPDFMQDLFKTAGFAQGSEADAAKLQALSFTSPATAGFTESAAKEAAAIAEAQWCNADNLNEFLEGKKMKDVHVIAADEAAAVLAVAGDKLVVSFKGGVVTNLAATQRAAFCADCKVSTAIEAKYNSVRAAAADALAAMRVDWPKAQVTVTGMGEGGAMAVLFALESAKDASVVTFGAPRVGNPAFARFYEASGLSARTFRVVHWRDPVPHMPSAEFEHVGVEIFYNQDSSAFRTCSADVACANEAVTIFNFLDHFNYFGKDTMQCMIGDSLDKKGSLTLAGAVMMTLREQGSALLTAPGTPVPAGLKDLLNVNKLFDAAPSTDAAMRRPGFDLPKEAGFPHEQATPSAVGTLHNFYPNNFDHSLVADLAHLPFVAFCNKEQVEAWTCGPLCDKTKETSKVQYIADEDPTKAAAVVAVNHEAQIIVLFKAGLPAAGLTDFEFLSVPSMCEDCKVNRGLYSQYLVIRNKVLQAVNDARENVNADITVMGWSFGGALATYGALDMAAQQLPVKMVITMGMPRAGNVAFVDHYHSTSLQHLTWRISHFEDPVTHLPPTAAGWHHVGTEVWYNEDFSRFRICDGSGEDSFCGASKPGFKLNTDHFTYFGLDYAQSATTCGGLSGFEGSLKQRLPVLGEAMGWITPLVKDLM